MISVERMEDIILDILVEHGIEGQINYLLTEYPEQLHPHEREVVRHIFEIIIIENIAYEAKGYLETEMSDGVNKINHSSISTPILLEIIWLVD